MSNWKPLEASENKLAWDFVYSHFMFDPYSEGAKIFFSSPHVCYDLSKHYNSGFDENNYNDLHQKALLVFREIAVKKSIIAINWKHTGYSFNPDLPFETDEFGEWLAPFFPNGDYIFFLTPDFKNVAFCDGINENICLAGAEIVSSFEKNRPIIFDCKK